MRLNFQTVSNQKYRPLFGCMALSLMSFFLNGACTTSITNRTFAQNDPNWKDDFKKTYPGPPKTAQKRDDAEIISPLEKKIPYNFSAYNRIALEYLDRGGMINAKPVGLEQIWFHVRQKVVCARIPAYQVDLLLPQEWFKFDHQLNIYVLLPEFWQMVRLADQTQEANSVSLVNNADTRLKDFKDPSGHTALQFFAKPSIFLNQFEFYCRVGVHWLSLTHNCAGQVLPHQPRGDPQKAD